MKAGEEEMRAWWMEVMACQEVMEACLEVVKATWEKMKTGLEGMEARKDIFTERLEQGACICKRWLWRMLGYWRTDMGTDI